MRQSRLLLLIFCFIFLPILLTLLSLITAQPRQGVGEDEEPVAGRSSRLRALFSFNTPPSLFPPSAIISLTDDNSTFFLARPAAFGPLLPSNGLSGQLWVGSGFNEDALSNSIGTLGYEGELGCSDVPSWDRDDSSSYSRATRQTHSAVRSGSSAEKGTTGTRRPSSSGAHDTADKSSGLLPDDGTDDYLYETLSDSAGQNRYNKEISMHADVQSLQESAEIAGKVVLLSRGGCGFLDKVKWVQRRGGTALIVGDDTRGGSLITMYARGDTSNITIPAVFTSYTTAHLLSSLIPRTPVMDGQRRAESNKGVTQKSSLKQSTATAKIHSRPKNTMTPQMDSLQKKDHGNAKHTSFFAKFWSLFGGGQRGPVADNSRRLASSGNIEWNAADRNKDKSSNALDSTGPDDDGFMIGVHDWRDPDLVPIKPSSKGNSANANEAQSTKATSHKESTTGLEFQGGIDTPGSGEYVTNNLVTDEGDGAIGSHEQKSSNAGTSQTRKNWFTRHFGWSGDPEEELNQFMKSADSIGDQFHGLGDGKATSDEHPGLWVTITPTNMSTSPFFDTLLVLVISPLITLTVVYALLLLRSRIRRRRWRAPKSVIERLPIRTYHTIATHSTSAYGSPRSSSPSSLTSVTSTSPLLGSRPREPHGRSRPRSQTLSSASFRANDDRTLIKEGVQGGSDLWRRKYIGRQVECVVCLEEYIDGQSQVMSLPCGHEFHAECM